MPRTHSRSRIAILLTILGLAAAWPAWGQDTSSIIRNEIEHIQQGLNQLTNIDSELQPIKTDAETALREASRRIAAGHIYASLAVLAQARDQFLALRAGQTHLGRQKEAMAIFQTEWEKAKVELVPVEQKTRERDRSNMPAALRAVAESAQGTILTLIEASRATAISTAPEYGFINLAEAQAAAESVSFDYSLKLQRYGTELPLRSIAPELQRLQERATAAFQPPISMDQHETFIALNSSLKLAGELNASRLYAGALYQYLRALEGYETLAAVAPNAAKQAELRQAVADKLTQVASSSRDDSIAQLFLERAQSLMEHNDPGPSANNWKTIQITLDRLLPAYFAMLEAPPAEHQTTAGLITVTLVRWPYT